MKNLHRTIVLLLSCSMLVAAPLIGIWISRTIKATEHEDIAIIFTSACLMIVAGVGIGVATSKEKER